MEHDQEPGIDHPADAMTATDEVATSEMNAADFVPAEEVAGDPGDPGDDSDAPVMLDATEGANFSADNVTLSQGGVQTIEAQTVSVSQGGVGRISADEVSVSQGGVGLARTDQLTLEAGASAFAVVADEATIDDGANVFLLLSGRTSGDGQAALDWRGLLVMLVGLALVIRVLRR